MIIIAMFDAFGLSPLTDVNMYWCIALIPSAVFLVKLGLQRIPSIACCRLLTEEYSFRLNSMEYLEPKVTIPTRTAPLSMLSLFRNCLQKLSIFRKPVDCTLREESKAKTTSAWSKHTKRVSFLSKQWKKPTGTGCYIHHSTNQNVKKRLNMHT